VILVIIVIASSMDYRFDRPLSASLSFAARSARICSLAIWRPIASAIRVSAASVSAARSTGALSFAGTMPRSGRASSSCIAGPRFIAVIRTIGGGIGDPTADCGLMPPGAVDADLHLARESAFGDLAVDGRARQAG